VDRRDREKTGVRTRPRRSWLCFFGVNALGGKRQPVRRIKDRKEQARYETAAYQGREEQERDPEEGRRDEESG
jgi:hypothetical protein